MVRKIANIMRTSRTVITASCLASEGFVALPRFAASRLTLFLRHSVYQMGE